MTPPNPPTVGEWDLPAFRHTVDGGDAGTRDDASSVVVFTLFCVWPETARC
jgi:hypothetical protein